MGFKTEPEKLEDQVPPEELQLVNNFLQKFVFVTDSTSEDLDLKLALKVLPLRIDEYNLYRVGLVNFEMVQKSLIAFQNDDQDELFNYYNNRNKMRLQKLDRKAT